MFRTNIFPCLVVLTFAHSATASLKGTLDEPNLACSPHLGPAEVIRIQVSALRDNSVFNDGIKRTFDFASPGNKAQTGPLERFTSMVLSPPYRPLVNHAEASYSHIESTKNLASQRVTVKNESGKTTSYQWVLSRQRDPEYLGCWMTDAVIPLTPPEEGLLTLLLLSLDPRT